MNLPLYKSLFAAILLAGNLTAKAQKSVVSAGGNATGSGGTVSYSIGQLVYHSTADRIGSITEGVQQPFEVEIITDQQHLSDIALRLQSYPNPTSGPLTLLVNEAISPTLFYQITSLNGQIISSEKITARNNALDLTNQPSGTYILHVLDHETPIKSFRIVKN